MGGSLSTIHSKFHTGATPATVSRLERTAPNRYVSPRGAASLPSLDYQPDSSEAGEQHNEQQQQRRRSGRTLQEGSNPSPSVIVSLQSPGGQLTARREDLPTQPEGLRTRVERPRTQPEGLRTRAGRLRTQPEGPEIQPAAEAPEVQPEVPEIQPEGPDIQPEGPDIQPEVPEIQSEVTDIQPEGPEIQSEVTDIQPEGPEIEPDEGPDIQPEVPDILPEGPQIEPDEGPEIKPEGPLTEPPGLPPLHSAVWKNDLERVQEVLKSSDPDPLHNLIWINRALYPAEHGNGPTASTQQPPSVCRPSIEPQEASMESATVTLKALLHGEYLLHACHPLTIAAAHGSNNILDLLLRTMLHSSSRQQHELVLTWSQPPPGLPPGCPWVTPLAAAALSGSGECVRLLAQAISRRELPLEDYGCYGCFRFHALVVAQSADAVNSLLKSELCSACTPKTLCETASTEVAMSSTGQHSHEDTELMLFRARLFHDSLGRPLAAALERHDKETVMALTCLSTLVESGLQPDCFLSHAEHPDVSSTSLLMLLVRGYWFSLQAGQNYRKAVRMLISTLLEEGAVVDDAPGLGCRQVGDMFSSQVQSNDPEAPVRYAFFMQATRWYRHHSSQRSQLQLLPTVMLLRYSKLKPAREDLHRLAAVSFETEEEQQEAITSQQFQQYFSQICSLLLSYKEDGYKCPFMLEGPSSPLLAFGALLVEAMLKEVESHSFCWYSFGLPLMKDLIRCTAASNPREVAYQLTWLVVDVLIRPMVSKVHTHHTKWRLVSGIANAIIGLHKRFTEVSSMDGPLALMSESDQDGGQAAYIRISDSNAAKVKWEVMLGLAACITAINIKLEMEEHDCVFRYDTANVVTKLLYACGGAPSCTSALLDVDLITMIIQIDPLQAARLIRELDLRCPPGVAGMNVRMALPLDFYTAFSSEHTGKLRYPSERKRFANYEIEPACMFDSMSRVLVRCILGFHLPWVMSARFKRCCTLLEQIAITLFGTIPAAVALSITALVVYLFSVLLQCAVGIYKKEDNSEYEYYTEFTYIMYRQVPILHAAAMPSKVLYKLLSLPQVSSELFACPVMRAIITWRWLYFTRFILLLQFLEHLLYMACFLVYAFSLSHSNSSPQSQMPMLILLMYMTLSFVVQEIRQARFFRKAWCLQPWNWLELASIFIMITIALLHLLCAVGPDTMRILVAVEVLLLFVRLLYFSMVDDRMGSFFRMLITVFRDCWLFFIFLGVMYVGWGLALAILLQGHTTLTGNFMQLFTMIAGDFTVELLEKESQGSTRLAIMSRVLMSTYQVLVAIIILNLLIAIVNSSYQRIKTNEGHESMRNKLTLIVETEAMLPAWLVDRMLKKLVGPYLYIVTPEAANSSSANVQHPSQLQGPGSREGGHRPSATSARSDCGPAKLHHAVQLLANLQARFETRIMSALSSREALRIRNAGPAGEPHSAFISDGREGLKKVSSDVPDLGGLLWKEISDLRALQLEAQRRQDDALTSITSMLSGLMERMERMERMATGLAFITTPTEINMAGDTGHAAVQSKALMEMDSGAIATRDVRATPAPPGPDTASA